MVLMYSADLIPNTTPTTTPTNNVTSERNKGLLSEGAPT